MPNATIGTMRTVGTAKISLPSLLPSAEGLRQAAVHQATGLALMRVASTGIRKGIYRFPSHEAANRASEEALVVAIALNARQLNSPAP